VNESSPTLVHTPPENIRDQIELIQFDLIIQSWFKHKADFLNATLEGYIDGSKVNIDPEELHNLNKLDKSFRLTNVQLYSKEVQNYCNDFLKKTGRVLTANVYFTPSKEAQCFNWHSDSQYSITYQLMGQKNWTFLKDGEFFVKEKYENEHVLNSFKRNKLAATEVSYLLNTGSWLEFPYCLLHKAQNLTDSPSAHITFAYNRPTWGDFAAFTWEKISGKSPRGNYMKNVSLEELQNSIKKISYDKSTLVNEFREYFEAVEEVKRNEGRPYGREL
jgi:hypothetical protein